MSGTPLMQQYHDVKARHADAIVLFRIGDFYEMFEDDAKLAARELELTLTSRNNGGASEVPLAGVPVKAATEYVRRLLAKGYRVAICEQMEDPKVAKGIVRREVVETITPGTVLADDWIEGKRNNFLVALDPRGSMAGIAALDLTTGEFLLHAVQSADLPTALGVFECAEVILPAGIDGPFSPSDRVAVTSREPWEFDPHLAQEELTRLFGIVSLDGLGIEALDAPAVGAAGALLRYAREVKPSGLPHLARPRIVRSNDVLPLDEMTRRNLELVEPLRPGDSGTTLLEVVDRTLTPMGARLCRRWLLAPLTDPAAINARLDAVATFVADPRGRDRLREAFDGIRDLERLAARAAMGRATPRELGALRDSIARLPDVREALEALDGRERAVLLEDTASRIDLLSDLREELARALVDRPPAQLSTGEAGDDAVRPGYDPELDDLRDARDGGKRYIAALQSRERERTGIGSLKIGFNRVFGYYLEITRSHLERVPADYERRQTLAGAERFVTPELKAYEEKVLGAEERIAAREAFVIDALRQAVGAAIGRIQQTAGLVGQLDVWGALGDLAQRESYTRPEVTSGFELELQGSRHPVIERMMPREAFIPNDVRLDGSSRVLLVTGPNMAGKSTVLRQVGLCVLLAQTGAFVPARRARIGVVDRLFTRVGASDNLARGQSTFMVEMSETSAILHGATRRSLVLLDEIGRGTSTYDGVAIAWAVTEFLHNVVGCKTVFATHYHELTQLTEELAHVKNVNVDVREVGDEIVFLHRLEPGGADRSYGIHVGRLAGLPEAVVRRAWQVLKLLETGHSAALRAPAPSPATTAPDAEQLGLFGGEGAQSVLRELDALNINALSPLEALTRIAAWQERFRGGGGAGGRGEQPAQGDRGERRERERGEDS